MVCEQAEITESLRVRNGASGISSLYKKLLLWTPVRAYSFRGGCVTRFLFFINFCEKLKLRGGVA